MSLEPISFRWTSLDELRAAGVAALLHEHWKEIAHDRDKVPLSIDWAALHSRAAAGQFAVFAAWRGSRLVGYVSFFQFYPERYSTTRYVNDDVFWLAPEERSGWTGYRMLKLAIAGLPRPCKLQFRHKLAYQGGRVGALLERLGLKPVEVVHAAFLE